jgi:dimethylargininase
VPSVIAAARELIPPGCRVMEIEEPGTMDGGDILIFGERVIIGISGRTNREGAQQLKEAVDELGYRSFLCPVSDSRLHFASAITRVRPHRAIGTAVGYRDLDAAGRDVLPEDEIQRIVVPDDELPAHNVVLVNDTLFVPAGNPVSVGLLREAGENVLEVPFEHFTRADAGLTCLTGVVF